MDKYEQAESLRRGWLRMQTALIETDLDNAMTFMGLARTELRMGDLTRVTQLLAKVRAAHEAVGKFLAEVKDPEEHQRLRDKHDALTDALEDLQRRMQPPEQEIRSERR
jgi:hypothetical protein